MPAKRRLSAIYLHIFVDKEVEAIEVEVSDARFQSVLDGKETVQHYVLHAILQQKCAAPVYCPKTPQSQWLFFAT